MFSQIIVDSSVPLIELIEDNLIEGCVEISDINSNVNGNSFGFPSYAYFNRGSSDFPFEDGIMLSTGSAESGGNAKREALLSEGSDIWGTDPDLDALGITNTLNATSIEFDLVSATNQIQFNYLFASEEYYGFNSCSFGDRIVFLIKKADDTSPFRNIAVIPNTANIPVSTETIRPAIPDTDDTSGCDAQNPEYFEGFNDPDTNYEGRTIPLFATASIEPFVKYHVKLIIADFADSTNDSAVFIEAISVDNLELGDDIITCLSSRTLNADIQNPLATYKWFRNNVEITGLDDKLSNLNVTTDGNYSVEISIPLNSKVCTLTDDIQVTLNKEPIYDVIPPYEKCDDSSGDGIEFFDLQTKIPDIINILPPKSNYYLTFFPSEPEARNGSNEITTPIENNTYPEIFVKIENIDTGCVSYAPFNLIVNELLVISPVNDTICDDDNSPNGLTDILLSNYDDYFISSNPNDFTVSYHNSPGEAVSGNNPINSTQPYFNAVLPYFQTYYVRVVNTISNCWNTTTLNIEIIDSPFIDTENPFYLDACAGVDINGVAINTATFNLNEILPQVLPGLTGVVPPTFYLSYEDAEVPQNPILDTENFTNTELDVQRLFIRVENEIGCATIVPFEVHTNLLLTGTYLEEVAICVEPDINGLAYFYLNQVTNKIANGIPNISFTYYDSPENRNDDIALDANILHEVEKEDGRTLFLSITNGLCTVDAQIDIIVNPLLLFEPPEKVQYCASDENLNINVDLHLLDERITGGNTDFEVSYFLDEQDAIDNFSNKELFFYQVDESQKFFARIENKASSCNRINPLEIQILPAPTIIKPAPELICDDDQDGFAEGIDLTKTDLGISDFTGLNITFYDEKNELITSPEKENFKTKTQKITIKVQDTISPLRCTSTTSLQIIVSTLPVIPTISNYEICESDGDGYEFFLLEEKDEEILYTSSGTEVLYFEDPEYTIEIKKDIPHRNALPNVEQPIYVKVQNQSDPSCFNVSQFFIKVSKNPEYNTEFTGYTICENPDSDGFHTFDLNEMASEIKYGAPRPLNISFFKNKTDAENNNESVKLESPYRTLDDSNTIYARVQEVGSICYNVTDIIIKIVSRPEVTPGENLILCSDNYNDDTAIFNLRNFNFTLPPRLNAEINYFEEEADVDDLSKAIQNLTDYDSRSRTVFLKVTDLTVGCSSVIPFNLVVNRPPKTYDVGTIQICDNDTKTYDLSQLNNVIVDDPAAVNISYHSSLSNAQNSIPLTNIFNYTDSFHKFFARIEDPNTGCIIIPSFNLQINPNPVAIAPPPLEGCDDDYDGFLVFDLSQQKDAIIGAENKTNFEVTFYSNPNDAFIGDKNNALDANYPAIDGEIIYARMQNNKTPCFDITSFSVIVHRLPVINVGDIVPLCMNDLPLIIDASTGVSGDTYLWSTGEKTNQIDLMPEDLGNYWITITSTDNCVAFKAFSVIESEEATINFTTTVDFADPNSITVDVSGIGNYVYILDDQEPQISNVFENVTFGPHIVTIRDVNGCQDVSKEVVVIDVPKFVTPNNDGYFDTWHIVGIEQLPGTIVYIYDRHGKLIKTLPSSSPGWDGTYRGQNMPSDDYWFLAKVKKDGVDFDVKGHFALKR
ncbi:choice-of-anchor L domain-containing protein [Gaetbulibacter aquiaggeris]|uniref:Choice-of-anchor L domain-containing protein n=1 Tax=Gaetbulibacter aquiaggeris TaxID=1735373 RepID=A0ABW7MNB3_9FLAO